jgi:acetoin utilization deacetylase AcuC-like enzyme
MPARKTGQVTFKASGDKVTIDIAVPEGTKLKDAMKIIDTVRAEAVRKFQPGPCTACISGRDFRLRDIRVLPERLSKNMAAFDLKTGKIIG